ncbi:MAG TPA: MgtC/SapB family protein [Gemmatimonadales bacterium]|jgi:putative Mg2+ transporter-C (MgtC) family protein
MPGLPLQQWSDVVRVFRLDLLTNLAVAILMGGAVGLERELNGKAAGLRTNILICVGAAMYTQLSITLAGPNGDPTRISAQIVSGVGFLGAGTILHTKGSITGLTSAATIWMVAAIGTAAGAGKIYEAAGATLLVLIVLQALGSVEHYLKRQGATVSRLSVQMDGPADRVADVERLVREAGLSVDEIRSQVRDGHVVVEVMMRGPARLHDKAKLTLLRSSGAYKISIE